jgi:hypothetical protein
MALPTFRDDTKPEGIPLDFTYELSQELNISKEFIPYVDYNIVMKHNFDHQRMVPLYNQVLGDWGDLFEIFADGERVYWGFLTAEEGEFLFQVDGYNYYALKVFAIWDWELEEYIYDTEKCKYVKHGTPDTTGVGLVCYDATFKVIEYKISITDYSDVRLLSGYSNMFDEGERVSHGPDYIGFQDPPWPTTLELRHNVATDPTGETSGGPMWFPAGVSTYQAKSDSFILVKISDKKYQLVANGTKIILCDAVENTARTLHFQTRVAKYTYHWREYEVFPGGWPYIPSYWVKEEYYTEDSCVDGALTKKKYTQINIQKPKVKLITSIKNISNYQEEQKNEL